MSDDTACKVTTPDQEIERNIEYLREHGWTDERIEWYREYQAERATLRHTSEHDKAAEGIDRRDHWRKADRDDRGPESRLLPVEERTGDKRIAVHRDKASGEMIVDPVTPQPDDPAGQGYVGSPIEEKYHEGNLLDRAQDKRGNPNGRDPHPDNPHDDGFLHNEVTR